MFKKLTKMIFGSRNQRVLKKLDKIVAKINALEPVLQQLSDQDLAAKTQQLKKCLADGKTLEDILPEAFAVVREASLRTLKLRHFDVQLIGGMVLHHGNIAEMLTGEGKTLVATLPAYLNALSGKGVHIITVNDYLAQRDAKWMEPIYQFLGLTVGVNISNMSLQEKQQAYAADITFGTNNEFGFDYLRDNMAFSTEEKVQRDLSFVIVDEVDSVLIDEARTPLIISGPAEDSSEVYLAIDKIIPQLKQREGEEDGDYYLDEKAKQAILTEQGHQYVENTLAKQGLLGEGESLYDAANVSLMHHMSAALRAHTLFTRDVDYIIKDQQIVIVDEHTGRLMAGRRWSDGLHQAVEAKEGVPIQNENQTLASITFQNYFRGYDKLAGMTGTADTEAYEFHQIYGLEVIVIPPNKPVHRKDATDKIYITVQEKFKAIAEEIADCQSRGQPVLVGTVSIEVSEFLAGLLTKENISHEVLNAKQHTREAQIIAQAGRPGAVTIATNMAGRGTDIVLGGNLEAEVAGMTDATEAQIEQVRVQWQQRHEQVVAAGGLHVLGTERHESRRIDNQLRGRSGRQSDPGSSRFYLSLEDNLLRIFASEKLTTLMQKLGVPEGEALESSMLTRVIENAQRKVEGHNFDIRKQLLEFDNVANEQRKVVYQQRNELLDIEDVSETIQAIFSSVATRLVHGYIPPQSFVEQWDAPGLTEELKKEFDVDCDIAAQLEKDSDLSEEAICQQVFDALKQACDIKFEKLSKPDLAQLEKSILLHTLDVHWKEHLAAMDYLRQGIHLRGYAQKNPQQEYKRESFELFTGMLDSLQTEVIATLCRLQIQVEQQEQLPQSFEQQRQAAASVPMNYIHEQAQAPMPVEKMPVDNVSAEAERSQAPYVRDTPKVGRNQICPCGSGKKYKNCHGSFQNQPMDT